MSLSSRDEDRLETATSEDDLLETLLEELRALRADTDLLEARIETLEVDLAAKDDRIDNLERDCDRLAETTATFEERLENCERTRTRTENAVDAALNKARIEALQARELEKGAHLRVETVDEHELEVPGDRLERITKDDGRTSVQLTESADPLDGGSVSLAYGDLLPIQQLVRMDEEMRRSTANALPTRLAAKLWRARTDSSIGDDPWKTGCKGIDASVKASDLKHWIRRPQKSEISDGLRKSVALANIRRGHQRDRRQETRLADDRRDPGPLEPPPRRPQTDRAKERPPRESAVSFRLSTAKSGLG